jgi:DNA ligase-1
MSAKLDGIRGIVRDGVLKSRKLLDIPSAHAQALFGGFEHHDGELIAGDPFHPEVYNRSYRAVMGEKAVDPDLKLYVFDHVEHPEAPWSERLGRLESQGCIVKLEQRIVTNPDEVLAYESDLLETGYEGAILRRLDGKYKFGRSTLKEGYALKLKRFTDDEGVIIGFEEGETNTNEAVKDELGHTKRSSHAAGKVPNGRVGKFIVDFQGKPRKVATGTFKHAELKWMFENFGQVEGQWLKFRHFEHGAMDDLRHARARGFRSPIDMGEPA